ncbi:MAG: sentrin/sumo protease 8 [Mycoplasmataceae bacterium RV_VA103A]|nr:MAG: sentrin/sumo protease 8 [Mycoplasmataceae bacterium RV_VA103A]
MLGKVILIVIILFLVWVISWFIPSPTKSDKNTGQISDWEYQKKQAKREAEAEKNKEWFKEGRWLTDKEIDWATDRLSKDKRFKILPAHQFHYVREVTDKKETGWELSFKELLNQINDPSKELIFIPINNPNFHWSLLVYEISTKKFYHYDTLQGANDNYIKPLVRELVEQIQAVRSIKEDYLRRYLINKHDLRQNNGCDCGIATIAIMRRIMELKNQSWADKLKYGKFRVGDDLGEFYFEKEREELRKEYLRENGKY